MCKGSCEIHTKNLSSSILFLLSFQYGVVAELIISVHYIQLITHLITHITVTQGVPLTKVEETSPYFLSTLGVSAVNYFRRLLVRQVFYVALVLRKNQLMETILFDCAPCKRKSTSRHTSRQQSLWTLIVCLILCLVSG